MFFTWPCLIRLAVLLWHTAQVLRLSVREGWRGNYISPEGYLPDGEMWFSEPLIDWYEQHWSPGDICISIAHISLWGVQVSNPPGKYNLPNLSHILWFFNFQVHLTCQSTVNKLLSIFPPDLWILNDFKQTFSFSKLMHSYWQCMALYDVLFHEVMQW